MKHLSKIALTKRDYFFLEITAPRCIRCGILCLNSICTYCQIDIDDGLEWPWLGKPRKSKKFVAPAFGGKSRDGSLRTRGEIGPNNRRVSGNGSSRGIGRREREKKCSSRRRGR